MQRELTEKEQAIIVLLKAATELAEELPEVPHWIESDFFAALEGAAWCIESRPRWED